MKKILVSVAVLMATVATAQVGIHTKKPQATLDVKAKTEDGSKAEGILVPRLTGDAALKMLETLTEAEHSMLIFVTEPASTRQSKDALSVAGYYRYEYHTDGAGTETKTWVPLEPSGLRQVFVPNGTNDLPSYRFINKNSRFLPTEHLGEGAIDMTFNTSGYNTVGATGLASIAIGVDANASAERSVALGVLSTASGGASIALGEAQATGDQSFAVQGGIATGDSSFAASRGIASGDVSFAVNGGRASGDGSVAFGGESTASGDDSFAVSEGIAKNWKEIAFGTNFSTDTTPYTKEINKSTIPTDIPTDFDKYQLFSIGTKSAEKYIQKSGREGYYNAMVILRDGSTGIAIPADEHNPENSKPTEKLDVNGTARLRTINDRTSNVAADKVVVADSEGVLKTIDRSALASTSKPYTAGAGITIDKNEISRTGLEEVTKEGKTGWRLIGVIDEDHPESYRSSIGNGALDLVSAEYIKQSQCYSRPPLDSSDRYHTHLTSGATGDFSVALGIGSFAKGKYSTALGLGNASGLGSVAIGSFLDYCFDEEKKADARGIGSVAIGATSVAMNKAEVAFGSNFSTDYTFPEGASDPIPITQVGKNKEQLFSIGTIDNFYYYGISSSKFHNTFNNYNAMVILRDGSTGIAIPADRDNPANSKPTEKLDVNGTARLRTINENAGNISTDKVVVADSKGVLKTIDRSALASTSTPYTAGAGITITDKNEISRTGLEEVTKDGKTGWRLIGQGLGYSNDPVDIVDIGDYALDLSVNTADTQCSSRPPYGGVGSTNFNGAIGDSSVALGSRASAVGEYSMALGAANASGESSIAIGNMNGCRSSTYALGTATIAIGPGSIAMNYLEIALGHNFSTDYTFINDEQPTKIPGITEDKEQLFSIGNSDSEPYLTAFLNGGRPRSNAMVILRDGSTGIAIPSDIQNPEKSKPTEKLDVNGTARLRTINENTGNVATDKIVVADSKGVLKTIERSALVSNTDNSKWEYKTAEKLIALKNLSDGITARTDDKRVTISDDSHITAKAFLGYNGARIFPDYVFKKYYTGVSNNTNYSFRSLQQVESFIKEKGHLPGYVSAKEIAEKGVINIGETQLINVEKIEELYLHTIEQEKKLQEKDTKIKELEARLEKLEQLVLKNN